MMAQLLIEVPDEVAVQVAAAVRERYAEVIRTAYPEGVETNAQAWRAVAAWWTANLLAEHHAEKTRQAGQQKVDAAERARDDAVRTARAKAWSTVQAVMLPPVPPPGEEPAPGGVVSGLP